MFARVETHGAWFGPDGARTFGWWTQADAALRVGVVIVPPVGYEYWTTHRSLRVLAESLARRGFMVLRLDLRGTGDACGDLWSLDQPVSQWRNDIENAVQELRRRGAYSVSAVGVRFGATLVLEEFPPLSFDRVVGWIPVTDGKRYARELSMLSTPIANSETYGPGTTRALAGTVFTEALLRDIASASLAAPGKPARDVLIIDRDDRPGASKVVTRLRDNGVDVTHVACPDAESMLDVPTEEATVPSEQVRTIVDFLTPLTFDAEPLVEQEPPAASSEMLNDNAIRERTLVLGHTGLVGVETTPVLSASTGVTVLFLNTGSEHHVGSGRVWVEFARTLATEGVSSVRLDFRGWGESPDDGHAPGRPYDEHCIEDVHEAASALRGAGHERIVVVGLCAGAWVGLRRTGDLDIDAFVAFNPQLYWQRGDPVEALMADVRRRRAEEIAEFAAGAASGEWDRLESGAPVCEWGRWIEELAAADFSVTPAFSPHDDGLEFLEDRFGSRIGRLLAQPDAALSIVRLQGLDHPMHRHSRRQEGLDLIRSVVALTR